jgi:hypothetical protein
MSLMRTVALASCCAVAVCLIAACSGGGGGGGGTPPQFVVSPANLSFSAASPNAARPDSQPIMATVNGVSANALFVRIVITGPAVTSVDNLVVTGPNSGQMMVHVADPGTIGPGNHASTLTITACTTDINCSGPQLTGSPATINVAYQVGAVAAPPDAVAPSVGTANVSDEVIIRGSGFTAGTTVSFGGAAALSTTFVSATEIRATYPTLAAGPYPITLNGGAIPFTGSLLLVDAGTLASATLNYPTLPQNMRGLAFDARRAALIAGTGFSTPGSNQVLRYAFNGTSWQAPQLVTVANLRGLTLSLDGNRLLALTDAALVEFDPATLMPQAITPRTTNQGTDGGSFLKSIVATNDGQALIISGGPNFNQRWLYAVAARTFSIPFSGQFAPAIGAPDNGSRVVLVEGGLSPAQPARQYSASSGLVSTTSLVLAHFHPNGGRVEDINSPVFDRKGTRMLVAGSTDTSSLAHTVYDANFADLGRVPSGGVGTSTVAYALSPNGMRAYIFELGSGVCRLRAFDLSAPNPGMLLPETVPGFPIDLQPSCPADFDFRPAKIVLNPSGDTLFIAGSLLIRVVRP